jgi:small conductance mechanosensitive channel
VLRDFDGVVHFVSHGPIEVASNYTRGYSRIHFNVYVPYSTDLDRVYGIIDHVGEDLMRDRTWRELIREAPRAAGVERFGEASLEVGVEGVTEPGQQWRVSGELRRRLKRAFDAEGIKLKD